MHNFLRFQPYERTKLCISILSAHKNVIRRPKNPYKNVIYWSKNLYKSVIRVCLNYTDAKKPRTKCHAKVC